MNLEERHSTVKWLFPLFFVLLYLNTLLRSEFRMVWTFSDWCTTATLLLMFFYLIRTWLARDDQDLKTKWLTIPIVLLMFVYTYGYTTSSYADFAYYAKVLLLLVYILSVSRIHWTEGMVRLMGRITGAVTLIFLIYWMMSDFALSAFKGIYRNENYLAVLLFAMVYFAVLAVKYHRGYVRFYYAALLLINLAMIVTTGSRSVEIALLVTLFSWIFAKLSRRHFKKLLYIVLIGNFLFMGIYVSLRTTAIGNALNDLTREATGKNLFSGRIEIWEQVVHAIMKHPLFGHGIGVNASDVTAIRLTAHNFYLQILLEVGLIGFVLYLIVLLGIWKLLYRHIETFVARLSASFMLGILVYSTFELTLNQNNYSIAMFQWLIMTAGIGFRPRPKQAVREDLTEAATIESEEEAFDSAPVAETRMVRNRRHRRKGSSRR